MPNRAQQGKPTSTKGGGAKGGSKTVKNTTKPKSVTKADAAAPSPGAAKEEPPVPVTQIALKQVQTTVLRDPEQKIRKAGKAALVIDNEAHTTQSFLRYAQDATFVQDVKTQKSDDIRKQILGSLRANRPMVVQLEGKEDLDGLEQQFDQITKGLLSCCMDRSITKWEKLKDLETPDDVDPYSPSLEFTDDADRDNFFFTILTDKKDHPEEFKRKFTVFAVDD